MCLITEKKHPVVKTAKEDIVCYKIVRVSPDGKYRTPFMWCLVEMGEEYEADKPFMEGLEIVPTVDGLKTVIHGGAFHSIISYWNTLINVNRYNTEYKNRVYAVAKCIIPKGSGYVEGVSYQCFRREVKCYASYKIKYVEIV